MIEMDTGKISSRNIGFCLHHKMALDYKMLLRKDCINKRCKHLILKYNKPFWKTEDALNLLFSHKNEENDN